MASECSPIDASQKQTHASDARIPTYTDLCRKVCFLLADTALIFSTGYVAGALSRNAVFSFFDGGLPGFAMRAAAIGAGSFAGFCAGLLIKNGLMDAIVKTAALPLFAFKSLGNHGFWMGSVYTIVAICLATGEGLLGGVAGGLGAGINPTDPKAQLFWKCSLVSAIAISSIASIQILCKSKNRSQKKEA